MMNGKQPLSDYSFVLLQLTSFSNLKPAQQTQTLSQTYSLLEKANQTYYQKANPVVDDSTYDLLYRQLVRIEDKYPQYINPNSPTQNIGNDSQSFLKKNQHKFPMLSLSNAFDINDLKKFHIQNKKYVLDGPLEYVCELKIDGVAISATYDQGVLKQATTRGNGLIGDDITQNIRAMQCLPEYISEKTEIEVRGELYMTLENFQTLYQKLLKEKKTIMNPRNIVAGSIKLKKSTAVAKRKIHCFLYFVQGKSISFNTYVEELQWLKEKKFSVNPKRKICSNIQETHNFCLEWQNKKKDLPYQIDGVVTKVNSKQNQNSIGFTSKHPRWAIAYKFITEKQITKLLNVVFQVGRTGKIVPVAHLVPILISGSTVSRASLHNSDEIRRLSIKIGDFVIVEKAGEIIPKIKQVKSSTESSKNIAIPVHCPICKTPLTKQEEQVDLYCPSLQCPAQIQRAIEYFSSLEAMNIQGLGHSIIQKLIEKKLINSIVDIYKLTLDQLLTIDKIAEKGGHKLLNNIENSKKQSLEKLLTGFGIPLIGKTIGLDLSRYFNQMDLLIIGIKNMNLALNTISIQSISSTNIDELLGIFAILIEKSDPSTLNLSIQRLLILKFKPEWQEKLTVYLKDEIQRKKFYFGLKDFKALKGIGKKKINSLFRWFTLNSNQLLLEQLKLNNLNLSYVKSNSSYNKQIENKTFVLTGTLTTLSRNEAKEKIQTMGGHVLSSLNQTTDFLIAGKKAGSKLNKAKVFGTKVLDEHNLLQLLNQ